MKIKKIAIRNFRLFDANKSFELDGINIPDDVNEGSGLTVFVGENGCGKTAILEAFALPLLSYKADSFSISDFNDPDQKTEIILTCEKKFEFKGTMPNVTFNGKGFLFEGIVRSRVNKAFLSSIVVSDQKFVKADGESKPKDNSIDLRVNVNNPFSGSRFDENDVLFLDKNRIQQTRSGTFNSTRFDRLMEDLDYQYIKKNTPIPDINTQFDSLKKDIGNAFLTSTLHKFKEISGHDIKLNILNNHQPFVNGFFANVTPTNQQIALDKHGSGYEMIFAILYSFYLSRQSNKQLIILIDEPELHMHPSLQAKFVEVLLEFSKTAQIILTTHSPLLIKQLLYNENVKIDIVKNQNGEINILPIEERILPYLSASEVNYLAFGLPSEEYHNELYEELKYTKGENSSYKNFDKDYFITLKGEEKNSPWKGQNNEVSIHTFIRNQIHHPKENGRPLGENLNDSIIKLRTFLKEG